MKPTIAGTEDRLQQSVLLRQAGNPRSGNTTLMAGDGIGNLALPKLHSYRAGCAVIHSEHNKTWNLRFT